MMRHILHPLLRHRMMPLLVMLQVALACAIACNALFLLQLKLVPMLMPDGIGHPAQLIIGTQIVPRGKPWTSSRLREVEEALRGIPGVASVSMAGSLPMDTDSRFNGDVGSVTTGVRTNAAIYIGDHLLQTLDLQLVAGRDFSVDEQATQFTGVGINHGGPTIITRALAEKLFPGVSALGQEIRIGKQANASRRTVVGVVAHLMRNDFGMADRHALDYTMLFPGIPGKWPVPAIGVRVGTAGVDTVRRQVARVVKRELGAQMVVGIDARYETYLRLRERAMAQSRASVWLLAGVTLVVLIVTLAGIMGMTAYWVQQRTRQIGVRRALGARRRDILRELQWENVLVVGLGVLLGLLAALAVNLWLMHHYELQRLPWTYLPLGAVLLLALGQLAVLAPALRASRVPPVVATRSV